jgi:pyridoxal phosphate enzyme (YggS family)
VEKTDHPRLVLEKLKDVRSRIKAAAEKKGRNPEEVELVAVTKYASLEETREIIRAGISQLGENRVQNALKRRDALGEEGKNLRWRFIGHLQTNKVKQALTMFDAFDAVDSEKLSQALQTKLEAQNRILPVLIQVKLAEREAQSGVSPKAVPDLIRFIQTLPNVRAAGLMAIAPIKDEVEETRPHFRAMKKLFDENFPEPFAAGEGPYLSMGMSQDFEIAVEEGANLVRIGSALFT